METTINYDYFSHLAFHIICLLSYRVSLSPISHISFMCMPNNKKIVLCIHRYEIYTLQFKSDGVTRRMTIDGPQPDNWFAVAFISWTDPNNDRIEQQGNYYEF